MNYYRILAFTLLTVIMPIKVIAVCPTYYYDADGDTFGNSKLHIPACSQPDNYVLNSTDCNDGDLTIYPGAIELCDDKDNDCDGLIDVNDDIYSTNIYYRDFDNDTYGNRDNSIQACPAPFGYTNNDLDCDDTVGSINPGAKEICDNIDNDCNVDTFDGIDETWLSDACDGVDTDKCLDGSFVCSGGIQGCNDTTEDNIEVCDGIDNDCDGIIPSNEADNDLDGYMVCQGDCDDTIPNINPNAIEICDGIDNNCDSLIDDGIYFDNDDDGICDNIDNCPFTYNDTQIDSDGDLFGNACDNCPLIPNEDQSDIDDDGIGDACANNMLLTPISPLVELDFFTINSSLDIIIIYDEITTSGYTSITTADTGTGLPPDYVQLGNYYNIETTASYINSIEVCIGYSGLGVINEKELYLFHQEDGAWVDIASFVDVYNHTICGETDGFSKFVISEYREEEEERSRDHCFIATAAYGTPLASEVQILSRFRDTHMLTNSIGQRLVSLYYRLSPPIAEYIKNSVYLKAITRGILNPVVWLASKFNKYVKE